MMVGNPASLLTLPTSSSPTISISSGLLPPNATLKIQPHVSISSLSILCFQNNYSLSYPLLSQCTQFNFRSLLSKRCDLFTLYAIKKQSDSSAALVEMSDFELDDEFEDFDDDGEWDEDEDEDGGMFVPLEKMKKWVQNKPRGFGEGKVYNTTIEDKLLDEIQRSRKAQTANINKLKTSPVDSAPNKGVQQKKAPEVVPSGICVCIINLPKKKNIHRDLKSAFKEVAGVINIIPAVSGNKKTKDPVCKGYAFVDFKSEEDASRFVQQFSGRTVAFGKVEKQIKCKITSSYSIDSSDDESEGNTYAGSILNVPALKENGNANVDMDDSSIEESLSNVPVDSDNEILITAKSEDAMNKMESFSTSDFKDDDMVEPVLETTSNSISKKKQDKNRTTKKKTVRKGRGDKVPKLEIPGSAKRLKIKEKAVLNDVFAKYGLQSPPLSTKKESQVITSISSMQD